MTIYFIRRRNEPNGPIKIGYSKNIVQRLEQHSAEINGGIDLIATAKGGSSAEKALHRALAADRLEGEWFAPTETVLKAAKDPASVCPGIFNQPLLRDRVLPEDEHSDDILVETRFYVNELVKREWRGYGDSVDAARDRVMDAIGVSRSQGKAIWCKAHLRKGVDGDTYRSVNLAYLEALEREGALQDHHRRTLNSVRSMDTKLRLEGTMAPGEGAFFPQPMHIPQLRNFYQSRSPVAGGMAGASKNAPGQEMR